MPVIRYPVGDRAVWIDPPAPADEPINRKFAILGRSEEAARVGPVSVYYEDMRAFLSGLQLPLQITAFQLLIQHHDRKDAMTVRIATPDRQYISEELESKIAHEFGLQRQMFAEAIVDNKIHPLSIEWIDPDEIDINSRTGKLRRVIDKRL
jgi:phenylacetate-CoA ligase